MLGVGPGVKWAPPARFLSAPHTAFCSSSPSPAASQSAGGRCPSVNGGLCDGQGVDPISPARWGSPCEGSYLSMRGDPGWFQDGGGPGPGGGLPSLRSGMGEGMAAREAQAGGGGAPWKALGG